MIRTEIRHSVNPRNRSARPGQEHVAVMDALTVGRLVRRPGDPLCRPASKFWHLGPASPVDNVTCARCRSIYDRLLTDGVVAECPQYD